MVEKTHWLTYHAITLKFIPLGYALILFFAFTPNLENYLPWAVGFDPLAILVGYFAVITGIIFLYEVGMALPDFSDSPSSGITAAVLTGVVGVLSLIYGIFIMLGTYTPGLGTSLVDWAFAMVLVSSIIMYTVQGREEFFHSNRFLKNMMDAI